MQRNLKPDQQRDRTDDPLDAPDVVWRRDTDNEKGWNFKPLIHVKPGTDLLEMLNQLRSGESDSS